MAFTGTISSGGRKITQETNTTIPFRVFKRGVDFKVTATSFSFETFDSQATIKLNDEETIHVVPPNTSLELSDVPIYQITILESGVEYTWTALY